MKKFLKNLEEELKKKRISEEEIKEILADHEEMIDSAINEGLSDEELEEKFGDPAKIADELSEFSSRKKESYRKSEKDFEFDEVNDNYGVEIKLVNEDIEIMPHDEETILVKAIKVKDIDKYTIELKDNNFLLLAPKYRQNGFFTNDTGKFEIYLPKDITLGIFESKNVNGDIEINDLKINEMIIGTTNGDLEFNNLDISKFKVSVINGDICINKVKCNEFDASMISGDAELNKLICENDIFVNTVSGDVEINNSSCNEFTLKTVSGDIEGLEFYPKTLSLNSVSGDISIINKDADKPIEIKRKKSVSGDIKIISGK